MEKQERIVNAALKEFAQKGYEKASTNEMIKEAGISKGSLFSYFNNKKALYLFLLDYVIKVVSQIYEEVDWHERDIFKRIKILGMAKFKIYKKFPEAFNFLKAMAKENANEVISEIQELRKHMIADGLKMGYKDIDLTKFREDIDIEKTLNIISWTMLSFAEQQKDQVNSFEEIGMEIFEEWDEYFDIMKRCFYKREEQ